MAFENWDWDEFMGGIADTGISGFRAGQEMRNAGEAARIKRLNEMRLNPEPYVAEYRRRQAEREPVEPESPRTTSFGQAAPEMMFGAEPEYGLGGIPEAGGVVLQPPMELDLGAAKEAADRQRAGSMYAYSDKAKEALKRVRDVDLELIDAEEAQKAREITATDVRTLGREYAQNNALLERSTIEVSRLQKELRDATNAGDASSVIQIRRELDTLMRQMNAYSLKIDDAMTKMDAKGWTPEDYALLQKPGSLEENLNELIKRKAGTTRTRRAGARGR